MAGWHHLYNEHELGQTSGDGEGQGGLACSSPWSHKESDTTRRLNSNSVTYIPATPRLAPAAPNVLDPFQSLPSLVPGEALGLLGAEPRASMHSQAPLGAASLPHHGCLALPALD